MSTNSFDIKRAVSEVPNGLAFWMALSCLKNAVPTFYNFNQDRFLRLDAICKELQTIAEEMKAEKAIRLKEAANRQAAATKATMEAEAAIKAGKK